MASKKDGGKKKGVGRRARTKAKRAFYYEMVYPFRKLLRIWKATGLVAPLKKWADAYRTPSGASGNGALVKLAKQYSINVNQQ